MAYLGNPGNTAAVLNKHGFHFQKKFGQNFLIDTHILEKIIDSAEITEDDCVLEIGPGIGTMTQYLAERAREVIAVEIDKALIPILADTLSEYDNVTVINEDVLKVDIAKLVAEHNNNRPIKVVANLPYYITTPIVMGLLESHVPLDSITIMVQKEVSLAVAYYCKAEVVTVVSPNCFIPKPNVASAVIRLKVYDNPPVKVVDEAFMFRIIRASFQQRRKTLVNGLTHAADLNVTKEQVLEALEAMGKPESVRGETFTLEEFARLSDLLK